MRGPADLGADEPPPPRTAGRLTVAARAETGLYRAEYEHDACGVAFVARLDATPLHETVRRALEALENLEHRGAAGADPDTGDGAGILMQIPDAFFRGVVGAALPAPGRYGVAVCFLPREADLRAELEAAWRRSSPRRARGSSAGATSRSTSRTSARSAAAVAPLVRQLFVGGGRVDPRPGRLRAQALRDPPAARARARVGRRRPELLLPHDRLQGDADRAAAPGLLPGPAGRAHRDRARARALALLDQHLPELGARPPVPDDRPQRRDQHAARATSTGCARASRSSPPSSSATTSAKVLPVVQAGRLRLGHVRQRARAAGARAAARCRTR